MSIFNAFFIFLLVWWTVLFAVLPIGVQRNEEDGKGYDHGAPRIPDLKKKIIINTIISAAIVAVIWILVDTGVIRWSEWFEGGFE